MATLSHSCVSCYTSRLKLLPFIINKDPFSINYSQELIIVCGGITLRILVVCVNLITALPQLLTASLPILQTSYVSLSADFDLALSTTPPKEFNVTCKKSSRLKLCRVYSVLNSLDVKKTISPDGANFHISKYCDMTGLKWQPSDSCNFVCHTTFFGPLTHNHVS